MLSYNSFVPLSLVDMYQKGKITNSTVKTPRKYAKTGFIFNKLKMNFL